MKHHIRLLAAALASILLLPILAACTGGTTGSTDTTGGDTPSTDAPTTPDTAHETDPATEPETEPEDKPWEVPAETKLGAANVALFCPVITNACEGGSNQFATDGDPETSYCTGLVREKDKQTFPYEVVIDLTRAYDLCGLRILRSNSDRSINQKAIYEKFRVELSADGLTYTEVATDAEATFGDSGIELPLSGNARFVRITSIDLGKRGAWGLDLSEIEVLSEITSHDNLLPSKRALAMQPGATDTLTAIYRLAPEAPGALSFKTSDPAVVTIDETTGALTAVANGEATLYVTDGENATAIPVTVKTPDPAYRVATFYLANHGENTREVMALLKESGITFLENCRPYDTYGNNTTEYLRVMANDYGLTLSISTPEHTNFLNMTDEEIRAVVAKYKNLPGFGGLYILDEPLDANQYARVYRAILAEDPYCLPHLNLLPGGMADFHGYVSDWVATVGGDTLKTLSYDNYPYGVSPNTFNTGVYDTMNEIRTTALLYNGVNTGYYIHSMGIHNAYRVPTDSEILYHAALGVAYGMKDFKHFVWFTPPYSGSGEHFITGVLNPEMGKSEIFEGVKAANAMLHTLSPILANTDAVELYHTRGQNGTKVPENFCINVTSNTPAIISVLVDRTTGQQYLVLLNKQFNKDVEMKIKVQDSALTELCDITSGEPTTIAVSGGKATIALSAGNLCVIKLPDGYDARADKTVNDGTETSLLSGIGASVSSSVGNGYFAYKLNDGKRTEGGWATNSTANTAYIVYDLKTQKTFNRMDIYPLDGSYDFFPRALSVSVSDDGVTYREVAAAKDINIEAWGALTFEATTARFVRIDITAMLNLGAPSTRIGEIELYMDNGQIPAMPSFKNPTFTPDPSGNVVLHAPYMVSSSYEAWGWTQTVLNDGRTDYVEGVHQGWCSQIGSQVPESDEWVAFILPTPVTISKMVIHPVGTFVSDYHVEVSVDGINWKTVASVEGDMYTSKEVRTLEFDAVEARYIRLVVTKMGVKSSIYEVGYVVQIKEIEVY